LSVIAPLKTVAVGIVVERSKGAGPWTEFLWRPLKALAGVPDTPAWTKLSDDGEHVTFYAGAAEIELYRSEAGNYRENLIVETPLLWVALRPTQSDPPFTLAGVTADPAEGESWAVPTRKRSAAAITSATRVSHDRAGKLFAAMVAAQARQRR
jgi:hypothetical protein